MIYNFLNRVYKHFIVLYNNINVDRGVLIHYGYVSFRYFYLFYKNIKHGLKYLKNTVNGGMEYILGDVYRGDVFECYEIKHYDTFDIHCYKIKKDDDIYLFDYFMELSCDNKDEILTQMLNDTYENIRDKDNNKYMLLYINLMLSDETILCDILDEINKLRYYFNCEQNEMVLKWRHIYEIIKHKYTKGDIDKEIRDERMNYLNNVNDVYVFMIINDRNLSEKVIMLSSILDNCVIFD